MVPCLIVIGIKVVIKERKLTLARAFTGHSKYTWSDEVAAPYAGRETDQDPGEDGHRHGEQVPS